MFTVPFTGGCSNDVFRDVLRNWGDHPVPGLTKSQFLRLAVPWVAGTGALADLLLGTRTEFAWRVTSPFFPSGDSVGDGRSNVS